MIGRLAETFVTLFVVLDPIGSVPIFLGATTRVEPADRRKVAVISVLVASGVLMLFLYLGQYLLEEMHIGIPAFRIAGAAILFVFVSTLRIGPFRTALIMNLEPLTATILSALVLGDVLTPIQGVGCGVMLAALVAFQLWR